MAFLSIFLITLTLASIFYLLFKKSQKKLNLPPGPRSYPVIGNSLQLKNGVKIFEEWTEKYGNIYTCDIGLNRTIIVSDPKWVRELFNDINITGRPQNENFMLIQGGPRGVINSVGKEWEEQRRDFGFGKNYLESVIKDDVHELLEHFKKNEGQPIEADTHLSLAVLNSLWQILASKKYPQDDPQLLHILKTNTQVSELASIYPLLSIPWLAKLIPNLSGYNTMLEVVNTVRSFILDCVAEHIATFQEDGEDRDFIDLYIREMRQAKDSTSSFHGELGEKNLIAVVADLFIAASDTTSMTLNFSILYLCKFLHVQQKVQEELDLVVGKNRLPSLTDRPKLPYCGAVIEEVLRRSTLIPIGVSHTALKDIKFHGYDIPKGTWILPNLYNIHFNPKLFPNPTEFNPTRFLSTDGKTVEKNENMFAFSTGRRVCLGEVMARDELFLFFTSIFHRFEIRFTDEFKGMDVDGKPHFMHKTPEYRVIMKDRWED